MPIAQLPSRPVNSARRTCPMLRLAQLQNPGRSIGLDGNAVFESVRTGNLNRRQRRPISGTTQCTTRPTYAEGVKTVVNGRVKVATYELMEGLLYSSLFFFILLYSSLFFFIHLHQRPRGPRGLPSIQSTTTRASHATRGRAPHLLRPHCPSRNWRNR